MGHPDPPTSSEYNRLPWTLTAAALTAFTALYFTADRFIGLPIMALLLVPSHAVRWRLPWSRITSWGLRILIVIALITWLGWPREDAHAWYLQPHFTKLFGCLLAAEFVVRAWERHDSSRPGEAWGVAVLLTALVMTAASNTFVRTYLRMLAPTYLFWVTLFLRSFVPPRSSPVDWRDRRTPGGPRQKWWPLVALRSAAVLAALTLGLTAAEMISRFDYQLTSLAVRLLQRGDRKQGEIGFDPSPKLEASFDPKASTERVLRIEGPRMERHLRVMAFETYAHRAWQPTLQEREFKELQVAAQPGGATAPLTHRLRCTRLADTADLLLVPLEAVSVEIHGVLERDQSGALRSAPTGSNAPYDVEAPSSESVPRPGLPSGSPPIEGPASATPDSKEMQSMRVVPAEIDPRVVELARHIAGDGDSASRLWRIIQHLQSTHGYSLEFNPHGEPLSDFILNGRSAHCQYFGSAVVVMARAVGIPSRFVTGYYAHESYGSAQMVVRQRDAHAWAECWLEGVGWVTADATPAGGRPDEIFPDPPRLRQSWERLQDLLAGVKQALLAMDSRTVLRSLAVLSVAGLLTAFVRFALARRRRAQGLIYTTPSAELATVARRFERWIRGHGGTVTSDLTWKEQLRSLQLPLDGANACAAFIAAYDDVRFGGVTDGKLRRAHELLTGVERQA